MRVGVGEGGVESGAVCLSVWCFVFVVWVELCSACV